MNSMPLSVVLLGVLCGLCVKSLKALNTEDTETTKKILHREGQRTTASEFLACGLPRLSVRARELHIDFSADGHLIGRPH